MTGEAITLYSVCSRITAAPLGAFHQELRVLRPWHGRPRQHVR